jgi:hypothetical protein
MLDDGTFPDGVANDGIYSASVTVGPNSAFGAQTLTATATDALGRTGAGSSTFTVIPPPAGNDECSTAIAIFDGTTPVSNVDAQTTTPGCTGSNDVWYSYVATSTGSLLASTCGNRTFDTTIAIWDGCPENGGVQIACNDDFCGLGSTVTWQGVEGQTYYVRFAGFGGQRGTADLTIGVPGPTNISAFGFASPDPVYVGDSTLLEVFVTPGENPTSTGLAVTIDTSSLQGGSSTQTMYDDGTNGDDFAGDNIFSFLQPIALEQFEQTYQFPYVVTDNEARSFNGVAVVPSAEIRHSRSRRSRGRSACRSGSMSRIAQYRSPSRRRMSAATNNGTTGCKGASPPATFNFSGTDGDSGMGKRRGQLL